MCSNQSAEGRRRSSDGSGVPGRPFDAKNPYLAPLRLSRRLQRGGERELMHLELDIEGSRIRYEAGGCRAAADGACCRCGGVLDWDG